MNRHTRAIVLTCISCRCVIGRLAGCADERSNGFLQLRGDPVRIQIRTYLLATLPRAIADDRYLVGCAVPVVSPSNRKLRKLRIALHAYSESAYWTQTGL